MILELALQIPWYIYLIIAILFFFLRNGIRAQSSNSNVINMTGNTINNSSIVNTVSLGSIKEKSLWYYISMTIGCASSVMTIVTCFNPFLNLIGVK